jgi:hypothetical protein
MLSKAKHLTCTLRTGSAKNLFFPARSLTILKITYELVISISRSSLAWAFPESIDSVASRIP